MGAKQDFLFGGYMVILYPSIDKLGELVDSKYTLVIAASRRARKLQEGAHAHAVVRSGKYVSVALRELELGAVTYARTRDTLK